jgi:hypothetical protein
MSDLRNRLDDLLAAVPTHVVPDDLATRARSAGVRRRRVRRAGVVAAAAVAVLVALGAVAALPRLVPVAPTRLLPVHSIEGYPVRIDYPYLTRALPRRPGPVAGLLERATGPVDHNLRPDVNGWYAVTADGHQWRLPGEQSEMRPSLSPDGTKIALFTSLDTPMVIRDLVTGDVTAVPDLGSSMAAGELRPWVTFPGEFSVWSADGRHVAVMVDRGSAAGTGGIGVIDVATGRLRVVPVGVQSPLGFGPDGQLLTMDSRSVDGELASVAVVAPEINRRTSLVLPNDVGQGGGDARLSPDGAQVALLTKTDAGSLRILRFDLASGALVASSGRLSRAFTGCPVAFDGSQALLPVSFVEGRTASLVAEDGTPVVVADERNDLRCSQWASDALTAGPTDNLTSTLFGTSAAWGTWWWREMALGAAVLVGLGAWWRLRRRRTRPAVAP